jgi:long-chain acyl-CoA synthetase
MRTRSFTFGDLIDEHRRSRPSRLAVVDGTTRLTYQQLHQRVERLTAALHGRGVTRGDRVLWLGQNSFRVLELLLACAKLGTILCPANWRSSEAELHFILADLDPSVVVWQNQDIGAVVRGARTAAAGDDQATKAWWIRHDDTEHDDTDHDDTDQEDTAAGDPGEAGYEAVVRSGQGEVPAGEVGGTDPLLAFYTAAFGGRPNAALLSHDALIVQDLIVGRMQAITDETVFLNSGPLFHVATFMSTNATLHHGGTNVFIRRTDPEEMCKAIESERCTHAVIMGPTLDAIIECNARLGCDLTSLWPTGDPNENRSTIVTPEGAPWRSRPGGYGQTEVVGLASFLGLGSASAGGAGRPGPGLGMRLVSEGGQEAGDGEVGEIVVRGLTVMSGYWNRPELNAERSRGGWHHTGDLGRRERDGSLTFVGPRTTLIKSAAENIYPAEVEACLTGHPAVKDVCVIGVPDPVWAQRIKAVVVLREGMAALAEDLVDFCRSRIASYKKPSVVEFVAMLPRTPAGAIDRVEVDRRFGGGGYPGTQP